MTLALDHRTGLPEALQILLKDYPRADWTDDPGFNGVIQFWLERHLMFRRLLGKMSDEAEARIDGKLDGRTYASRLSRFGGIFINELHHHHMIEDAHYFPVLSGKDARITHGFTLLDADHTALDGVIDRFATSANAVLQAQDDAAARSAAGGFLSDLRTAERLLDRHLNDEEELIVPVILKYGTEGLPGQ